MELAELMTQHIPELLVSLGYRPPPPAEDWAEIVQNSMQVVLTADDDAVATRSVDKARQELAFFNWRLRDVVEDAERAQSGPSADNAVPSRLLAADDALELIFHARSRLHYPPDTPARP